MEDKIKKILETPFWPEGLESMKRYYITQDDCDGDFTNGLNVTFSEDGDAWVNTEKQSCRFRTYNGGGRNLRVRNALIILAIAIKMDNEE